MTYQPLTEQDMVYLRTLAESGATSPLMVKRLLADFDAERAEAAELRQQLAEAKEEAAHWANETRTRGCDVDRHQAETAELRAELERTRRESDAHYAAAKKFAAEAKALEDALASARAEERADALDWAASELEARAESFAERAVRPDDFYRGAKAFARCMANVFRTTDRRSQAAPAAPTESEET